MTHLRVTGTCHTLKDLEKTLPAVASINSIQVKEYIQALTDEGQVRVEKIGNGNWYWSFKSEERAERERQLARVKTEVEKARKSCTDAELALAAETTRRQDASDHAGVQPERQNLLARKAELETEVHRLRAVPLGDSVSSKSVQQLRGELAGFRQQALQWTDNLYVLEQHLRELASGDRDLVATVLCECYGDEYVDGGLRELK